MANAAPQSTSAADAGDAAVAANLADATQAQGLQQHDVRDGSQLTANVSEPGAHHVEEPTALGFNTTGWVGIAALVVLIGMLIVKVPAKIAASLDGRTALANGQSQWITGPAARKDGHAWRARACAVLTGIGTVTADDPQLNVREVPVERQPLRVIVDSRLETPLTARILQGGNVLMFCAVDNPAARAALEGRGAEVVNIANANGKVELPAMLAELGRRGINELHVEAGVKLNGSLVREGCVDELLVYLAPSFLGDTAQGMASLALTSLDERVALDFRSVDRIGDDLRIVARFKGEH